MIGKKTAPSDLPKLVSEARLIVNHENEQAHAPPAPDLLASVIARGRTILNSVNSPGTVSTSIEPPCCLTMMS